MAVPFYMDVHVPWAITQQLRRLGVNVLTAGEDGFDQADDAHLLQRATDLKRPVFTHDIRFKARAQSWQREGRHFAGLFFGHQMGGTIGEYVRDLRLINEASEADEWINVVEYLPYRQP